MLTCYSRQPAPTCLQRFAQRVDVVAKPLQVHRPPLLQPLAGGFAAMQPGAEACHLCLQGACTTQLLLQGLMGLLGRITLDINHE